MQKEIVNHHKNGHALLIDDGFVIGKRGRKYPKMTTQGWDVLVEWKDGTSSWVSLKDLKASNPIKLAEYAKVNKLMSEPVFSWWVNKVLRRRDCIIGKVASRYWKRTHKYGVEFSKSVKEALAINAKTGTKFWCLAIERR